MLVPLSPFLPYPCLLVLLWWREEIRRSLCLREGCVVGAIYSFDVTDSLFDAVAPGADGVLQGIERGGDPVGG